MHLIVLVFFVFVELLIILRARMSEQADAAPMLAKTYLVAHTIVLIIVIELIIVMDYRLKVSREVDVHILVFAARHGNTEYRLVTRCKFQPSEQNTVILAQRDDSH